MSARIVFGLIVLASIGFGAAALIAPGSHEYREPVPISFGSTDAPIHVIVYGDAPLPSELEADVSDGTTKLTIVRSGEALDDCTSMTNCSSTVAMPTRLNPSGVEPLVRIGYRPSASIQLTQAEDIETEYTEHKLRIGR